MSTRAYSDETVKVSFKILLSQESLFVSGVPFATMVNLIFLELVVEDLHKLTGDLFSVSKGSIQPTMKDVES